MDAEQAIHSFWSNFGLTAYDENSVPDNAQLPYITYSVSYDSFDDNVSMTASIYYRSTSWIGVTNTANQIYNDIGFGGKILKTDNGGIVIHRGSPFYQRKGNDTKDIKGLFIIIQAEYIQN